MRYSYIKISPFILVNRLKNNRTIGSNREIVNLTLNQVDQHTKMQLPGLNVMSRNIRKWRNRVVNAPAIPQNRTGFLIPESISKFPDNSKFLVYDSGVNDPDRILIFSSNYALKALASTPHIATDGTFKLCPSLWTQMITVHGLYPGCGSIPYVFGLLPNKSQETYVKFFTAFNLPVGDIESVSNQLLIRL